MRSVNRNCQLPPLYRRGGKKGSAMSAEGHECGPWSAAISVLSVYGATCWHSPSVDALNPEKRPLGLGPNGQGLPKTCFYNACRERTVPKLSGPGSW